MNYLVDIIYVINLNKDIERHKKLIYQFELCGIYNYQIVSAVEINSFYYTNIYNEATKNLSEHTILYNYQKGALGCTMSHLYCIFDAQKNNHQKIIIVEDDIIPIHNLQEQFIQLYESLPNNWDFVYLGKKQGLSKHDMEIFPLIHTNSFYLNDVDPNQSEFLYYRPNYKTWATHALLINSTIYDSILNFKNLLSYGPIDLLLMTLYDQYNFYVAKNDIFITDDNISNICVAKRNNYWDWNTQLYNVITTVYIQNIIIWGFKQCDHHTHYYIHSMYYHYFKQYFPDLNVVWLDFQDTFPPNLWEKSIIFYSPTHSSAYTQYPPHTNTQYYIIHLDNFPDNCGYKKITSYLNDPITQPIIQSNQYIVLLARETITPLKYFESSVATNMICLPWFNHHTFEEICRLRMNIENIYEINKTKRYLCFIGSVWYLNIQMIKELIRVCIASKTYLLLKGRVFGVNQEDTNYIKKNASEYIKYEQFHYSTSLNAYENSFAFIDAKYGIRGVLPIQGIEHNNNYISNRIFETLCNGYIIFTNNKIVKRYFHSAIYYEDLNQLIEKYNSILDNKQHWLKIFNNQMDEYLEKFYGYNNINLCFNALNNVMKQKCNQFLFYQPENMNIKKLWFVNNPNYDNLYFTRLTNITLNCALTTVTDYIFTINDTTDLYMIDRIISLNNYIIQIDNGAPHFEKIIHLCNKYDKKYQFIEPIKVYSIVSSQRVGSTLIIDILQKRTTKVLAVSEIIDSNYLQHYDSLSGILKGFHYNPITDDYTEDDLVNYVKQFIDFAYYHNYKYFIFKFTIDFMQDDLDIFHHRYAIFEQYARNNNVFLLYIHRNYTEIYESKILADRYGYSHVTYNPKNEVINYSKFNTFCNNIQDFLNKHQNQFQLMIDYTDFQNYPIKQTQQIFYKLFHEHVNEQIDINMTQINNKQRLS